MMDILDILRRIPKRCQVNVAHFDGRLKWRAYCNTFVGQLNVKDNWDKYYDVSHYYYNHIDYARKKLELKISPNCTESYKLYIFPSKKNEILFVMYILYDTNDKCVAINYDFVKCKNLNSYSCPLELYINSHGLNFLTNYTYCIIRHKNTIKNTIKYTIKIIDNYDLIFEYNVHKSYDQYFLVNISKRDGQYLEYFAI